MTRPHVADWSADELRDYACEHVFYEIDMFVRSVEAVAADGRIMPQNFSLEVFAVHLRNLLDFFYPPSKPRSDDVFATHFFSDPSRWNPPAKTPLLSDSHKRAHKEVAHLTTGRKSDPDEKLWNIGAIYADLAPVIRQFAMDADLVCGTFLEDVTRKLESISR